MNLKYHLFILEIVFDFSSYDNNFDMTLYRLIFSIFSSLLNQKCLLLSSIKFDVSVGRGLKDSSIGPEIIFNVIPLILISPLFDLFLGNMVFIFCCPIP